MKRKADDRRVKRKADDRRDNVEKIQFNIDNTIQNMEMAEEMIAITDDEKTKKNLLAKNKRRQDALEGFRQEIQDEAKDRERGYE
ncbi:MAG: small acid-soluble spore protein Tlp [Syntrophomonadaceae bacterium]|jgi:small acid-soluble spore protein (thioredoxin-like protein)|nr:small acid-soluble spore protein Tlp [Syntrophomonadaceae bacterium]